jgi:LuxR family maltose regulon positive regulatory protein
LAEKLGRYEILEEIGQGGFAIVYRARDTQLERLVALKELRPALLHNTDWVKRFHREARTIARLDHPHIVTIYDVYEVKDRLFIVLRLVNGPSLEKLLATQGRFPWSEAVEIIDVVADGLDYAHTQGILHRDLKPANILLDPERGPMLSDFGLAKLVDEGSMSVTATGSVVGTPHYIAPEVWEGQGTTPQSDIYALGCILYEMLTGEKVFQGETPPTVMMSHFSPLAFPKEWPEGVPAGVAKVIETALAKQPARRYDTANEMVEALAKLAATPFVRQAAPVEPRASPSILMTKLYRPPTHPDLVHRPRLTQRLTDALRLQHKLTLISAPAGFGKTTLVSAWLSEVDELDSTWLTLDENDNNLTRFLTYVIAALQQLDAGFGRSIQATLQASPSPAVEPLITTLINQIAALDTSFVFVLDDYHVITLSTIHEAVNFLLDHIPPQMRLVITSRADLPFSFSRLRVRRQVTEIWATDLRFTKSEAAAFLNQMMNLNLSVEAVTTLEARTEGWVAGLQLAALSMGTLEEVHRHDFIAALTGDDRYILDYLIEEVLDRQPAHIQTFLLQTSILERLSGQTVVVSTYCAFLKSTTC